MPIDRLLALSELSPERQEVLKRAFDRTLRELNLVDRNDPICEIVARKIIEVGAKGISSPAVITEIACRELRS